MLPLQNPQLYQRRREPTEIPDVLILPGFVYATRKVVVPNAERNLAERLKEGGLNADKFAINLPSTSGLRNFPDSQLESAGKRVRMLISGTEETRESNWGGSQVAKATDCKSVTRGFDSLSPL